MKKFLQSTLAAILIIQLFSFVPLLAAATDVKNDANLPTSLIAYWEMEETSGTRTDSHGSLDLSDTGSTGYTSSGVQNNAADFNGSSQALSVADPWDYQHTGNDFSYSLWFQPDNIGSGYEQLYMHYNSNKGTSLIVNNTNIIWYIGKITQWPSRTQAHGGLTNGNWYHLVLMFDSSAQQVNFYLNGSSITSGWVGATYHAPFPNPANDPNTNLVIAANDGISGSWFDGKIDEVGYWEKILTATEISDLYNSGSGIPYDAGGGGGDTGPGTFLWFQ